METRGTKGYETSHYTKIWMCYNYLLLWSLMKFIIIVFIIVHFFWRRIHLHARCLKTVVGRSTVFSPIPFSNLLSCSPLPSFSRPAQFSGLLPSGTHVNVSAGGPLARRLRLFSIRSWPSPTITSYENIFVLSDCRIGALDVSIFSLQTVRWKLLALCAWRSLNKLNLHEFAWSKIKINGNLLKLNMCPESLKRNL